MKILFACLLGLLAVIPSVLFQVLVPPLYFSNPFLVLLQAIFITALIEEGSKALAFYLFPLRFLKTEKTKASRLKIFSGKKNLEKKALKDKSISLDSDVILGEDKKNACKETKLVFLYGFFLGLSFGFYELLVYFISGEGALGLRFFTTVFFHAFCAVLGSFFIFSWKKKKIWFFPIAFAIFMHGLYNFFAEFTGILWWFSILVLFLTILQTFYFYATFRKS
jgi:RsiW-degrading membrane proteinase PrsW (M82 family)